jgi:hypothetical protein
LGVPEHNHWKDKPTGDFCLTMDREEIDERIAAHKRGCRFCDLPNPETPLTKRYDSTLGKVYVCEQHTSHTMTWEEYRKSKKPVKVAKTPKLPPAEQQQTLFS